MDKIKKAGSYYGDEAPDILRNCFKLSWLSQYWDKIVDGPVAANSQPAACSINEDGLFKITIHVQEGVYYQAMLARQKRITQQLRKAFRNHDLVVEIKRGKITRESKAKEPLPNYKRHAPVILDEARVKIEAEELNENAENPEIAELLARIKLSTEKINSRKK